jgi:hypothetical protein
MNDRIIIETNDSVFIDDSLTSPNNTFTPNNNASPTNTSSTLNNNNSNSPSHLNQHFNFDISEHESRFFLYTTQGTLLSTLYVGDDLTHKPDFCIDNKYILLLSEIFVYVIDSRTGKLIVNVPSANTLLADVFENRFLVTVSGKGVVRIWNVFEGNLLLYYDLHEDVIPNRFLYYDSIKRKLIVPTLWNVYVFNIPFLYFSMNRKYFRLILDAITISNENENIIG